MAIDVADSDDRHFLHFDPAKFFSDFSGFDVSTIGPLKRPKFIPIVASVLLAQSMLKRAQGNGGKGTKGIDGFVIEMPAGCPAPPRGFKYDAEAKSHALALNERGEPVRHEGRGRPRQVPQGGQGAAVLDGGRLRQARDARVGARRRRAGDPGGHRLRLLRGVGLHRRGEADALHQDARGRARRVPPRRLAHRLPLQGRLRSTTSRPRRSTRTARASATLVYLRHAYQDDKGRIGYARRRARRGLDQKGRRHLGDRRAQVPVQRADGRRRLPADLALQAQKREGGDGGEVHRGGARHRRRRRQLVQKVGEARRGDGEVGVPPTRSSTTCSSSSSSRASKKRSSSPPTATRSTR